MLHFYQLCSTFYRHFAAKFTNSTKHYLSTLRPQNTAFYGTLLVEFCSGKCCYILIFCSAYICKCKSYGDKKALYLVGTPTPLEYLRRVIVIESKQTPLCLVEPVHYRKFLTTPTPAHHLTFLRNGNRYRN